MPRFEVKQSRNLELTSHAGLGLIGQCFEAAQVEAVLEIHDSGAPEGERVD